MLNFILIIMAGIVAFYIGLAIVFGGVVAFEYIKDRVFWMWH